MSRKAVILILNMFLLLAFSSVALAAEGEAQAAGLWSFFGIAIACGFGIGVAAMGTGLGMKNMFKIKMTAFLDILTPFFLNLPSSSLYCTGHVQPQRVQIRISNFETQNKSESRIFK
jgi:hypothetical protein